MVRKAFTPTLRICAKRISLLPFLTQSITIFFFWGAGPAGVPGCVEVPSGGVSSPILDRQELGYRPGEELDMLGDGTPVISSRTVVHESCGGEERWTW